MILVILLDFMSDKCQNKKVNWPNKISNTF